MYYHTICIHLQLDEILVRNGLKLDAVIEFCVQNDDILVKRITGRSVNHPLSYFLVFLSLEIMLFSNDCIRSTLSLCLLVSLSRLLHPKSGRTYHDMYCPPKVSMKDDVSTNKNPLCIQPSFLYSQIKYNDVFIMYDLHIYVCTTGYWRRSDSTL